MTDFNENGEITFRQHLKNFFWLFLVPAIVLMCVFHHYGLL